MRAMTYAEIKAFCARIRENILERLKDELNEEQYALLVRANDEWLGGWIIGRESATAKGSTNVCSRAEIFMT